MGQRARSQIQGQHCIMPQLSQRCCQVSEQSTTEPFIEAGTEYELPSAGRQKRSRRTNCDPPAQHTSIIPSARRRAGKLPHGTPIHQVHGRLKSDRPGYMLVKLLSAGLCTPAIERESMIQPAPSGKVKELKPHG